MDAQYSKDFIYGNFTDGGQRTQFPVDVETLAALQNNAALMSVLGNMVGADKVILCGCDSSPRREGYVWIRSARSPKTGEVLHYGGGSLTSCYIRSEDTGEMRVDNVPYDKLYTTRSLVDGVSPDGETYLWSDFVRIDDVTDSLTLTQLLERIKDGENEVAALKNNAQYTFVRGMIMIWSGSVATIPEGWALCDGSTHTIDGVQVRTPNLCHKFVRGVQQVAQDAYDVGATGGAERVTLTENQMPSHTHTATCAEAGSHYHGYIADDMVPTGDGTYNSTTYSYDADSHQSGNARKLRTTPDGYHQHTITIGSTGGGQAHENLPPYYTLAYIMKL